MVSGLNDKGKQDGVKISDAMVALRGSLFCTEKNSIEFLFDVTGLVGKDLSEVVWCYTEKTCGTIKEMRIDDIGSDILCIGIGKLKVTKEEDGDEETKDRCQVLLLETESVHGSTEVTHTYGIITEGTRRQAIAA